MVSICIPSYQNLAQLRALLDSIVVQRYTNYEIILSDDSPGEEIATLVRGHLLGTKIRYYHNQPAKGSPGNWNYAISQASGEYIKVMHHDDAFAGPESLGNMVEFLEQRPDLDLVYCRCSVVNEAGQSHLHRSNRAAFRYLQKQPFYLFDRNFVGPPSCVLYRRRDALSFNADLKWLVDIDFYIRYFQRGTCGFLDELLIVTHTHAQSVTNALDTTFKLREELQFMDLNYREIPEVIRSRWLLRHFSVLNGKALPPIQSPALRGKIRRMILFSAIFALYYKCINYWFWRTTERYFFETKHDPIQQ